MSGETSRFEELVMQLSAAFVRAAADEIDREITRWLRKIVLGLNLDRSAIAQIDSRSQKLVVSHHWAREGVVALPLHMELARHAPWFDRTLMTGRTLVFSRIEELQPEFDTDLKLLGRYVPKSNVTIPLRIGGKTVGALGFATVTRERSWPPRLVRRLQLVAEIFGNALERKRSAAENALLRRELTHVSRVAVMGELAAALAHQLNQPMAAILSNAEAVQSMLESDHPDLKEVKAAVTDIVEDDLRAGETIKGMRAFFRRDLLQKETLHPGRLADEVVRMLRSDALIRNVAIAFEAPGAVSRVLGDRIQLQQALINLLLNAFDAVSGVDGPREVTVRVVDDESGRVRMIVRDSGKGIDPAAKSRIFDSFFTTKSGGMGMGLSIARSIVQAHQGSLSVSANPDRGSTFEILLPAAEGAA
jgi:signal transduction histidine kinase